MYRHREIGANIHLLKGEKKQMKRTSPRIAALILCCICITQSLIACSSKSSNKETNTQSVTTSVRNETTTEQRSESLTESESSTVTGNNSQSSNDISKDVYEEKISYYMDLVESLQDELLEVKEQNYIEAREYEQKISELEGTVQTLLNKMEAILTGNAGDSIAPSNKDDNSSNQLPSPDGIVAKSDFQYVVNGGSVTIVGYLGKEYDVEIPSVIDGMPVVAIGEAAFKGSDVTSVIIPSSVKLIDWFAFAECTSLCKITIPYSVKSVSYGAFDYCPKNLQIICEKGSYIEAYALSWGMNVVAN